MIPTPCVFCPNPCHSRAIRQFGSPRQKRAAAPRAPRQRTVHLTTARRSLVYHAAHTCRLGIPCRSPRSEGRSPRARREGTCTRRICIVLLQHQHRDAKRGADKCCHRRKTVHTVQARNNSGAADAAKLGCARTTRSSHIRARIRASVGGYIAHCASRQRGHRMSKGSISCACSVVATGCACSPRADGFYSAV